MRSLPKNNSALLPILFFVTSLLTLGACGGEGVYYHAYQPIARTKWLPTDTLCFETDIRDSMTSLRLSIGIRHQADYPYHELPLVLTCTDPDSLQLSTDTLTFMLADKQGKWQGKGIGGIFQLTQEVGRMDISKAGRYRFCIHHVIPDDTILGISDVGIQVESDL